MKQLIIMFVLISTFSFSNKVFAQTYTTESKSCGSCGKAVSNNSKVGMTCPHCGVRWGYENESRKTKYNYNSSKKVGFVTSNAKLRSKPSTNAYVLTIIPAYTSISILQKFGDWYYVTYSYYDNNFNSRTLKGYIHKSLIN